MKIASCRAGNVIGGGDWAKDRIVPDCIAALQKKQTHSGAQSPRHASVAACAGTVERLSVAGGVAGQSEIAPHRFARADRPPLILAPTAIPIARSRNWSRKSCDIGPGRWQDKSDPKAPHEAGLAAIVHRQSLRLAALAAGVEFFRNDCQNGRLVSRRRNACARPRNFKRKPRRKSRNTSPTPAPCACRGPRARKSR